MSLSDLIENNRQWAETVSREQPDLFSTLAQQQHPKYLWIGCSDSRVPANEIVGLLPGELFVHRNVANLVKHVDLNCQSVVQYAVDVLGVEHIIVCGHYGCGGVKVAMGQDNAGISDYWLRSVKDICLRHQDEIAQCDGDDAKLARMCEINVVEQVSNLANSKIVQTAWKRGQKLHIHGWIYSIEDGIINDLKVSRDASTPGEEIYSPDLI